MLKRQNLPYVGESREEEILIREEEKVREREKSCLTWRIQRRIRNRQEEKVEQREKKFLSRACNHLLFHFCLSISVLEMTSLPLFESINNSNMWHLAKLHQHALQVFNTRAPSQTPMHALRCTITHSNTSLHGSTYNPCKTLKFMDHGC